jgi:hypothetical protein
MATRWPIGHLNETDAVDDLRRPLRSSRGKRRNRRARLSAHEGAKQTILTQTYGGTDAGIGNRAARDTMASSMASRGFFVGCVVALRLDHRRILFPINVIEAAYVVKVEAGR